MCNAHESKFSTYVFWYCKIGSAGDAPVGEQEQGRGEGVVHRFEGVHHGGDEILLPVQVGAPSGLLLSHVVPYDFPDGVAEARTFSALDQPPQVGEGSLIQGQLNPLHTQSHTSSIIYTDGV